MNDDPESKKLSSENVNAEHTQNIRLRPSEEQAHRLAAETAAVMAEVFLTQGWTLRGNLAPDGNPAIPTGEQIEAVVAFCLQEALTPKKGFLPEYGSGRVKVEVYRDLSVAEVWLRVGDLQWTKPDMADEPGED